MTDNILTFDGETTEEIPCDRVLEAAVGQLEEVLIIGRHADGNIYIASSAADLQRILWNIEIAKKEIILMGED